jgi:hypothetical protein
MDSFDNATERSLSNGRQTSTFVLDNPFPPPDPISGGKDARLFYGESMAGVDEAYRYYFRILFRAGTIGGNIVFGLAFFVIARRIASSRIKDYLIITGIGDTMVGIALSMGNKKKPDIDATEERSGNHSAT